VYVKPVGRGAAVRLTRQAAAEYSPAWSPDGGRIAFLRAARGNAGLSEVVVMPAAGGPERKVGEVRLEPDSFLLPGPFLCWTPDASALVVTERVAGEKSASLHLLSLETGRKQQLTAPPLGAPGDSGPSFSPDGRTLVFARFVGFAVADIYVVALTAEYLPAGDAARRTYENRFSAGTAWTPGGKEILYSGYWSGERALYRVKGGGPEAPERLQTVGQGGTFPAVSARAQRLVYARPRISEEAFQGFIAPAPDGWRRAFASARSGSLEVWTCGSGGGDCTQMTSLQAPFTGFPRWSPDGQYLVFFSNLEGQNDVYVIPAAGGRPRRLTDDPGDDILPVWSRDGDWIYFWSNRAERYQVWKVRSFGADLEPALVTQPEELAAAGRLALPGRAGPPSAELVVVEDFR
jgi:Tol biopolymer transport system component